MKMKKFIYFCLSLLLAHNAFCDNPYEEFELQNAGENPIPLDLKIDANGNSILLFVNYDGTSTLKFAYKPAASQTFETPVVIMKNSGANALSAKLAIDSAGNAIVTWSKVSNSNLGSSKQYILPAMGVPVDNTRLSDRSYAVYYAYRAAGSNTRFDTPKILLQFFQSRDPRPLIAFDGSDNAILTMNSFSNNILYYAERASGASSIFTNIRTLQQTNYVINSSQNLYQTMIADSNGNITISWNTESFGTRYATRNTGNNKSFGKIRSMDGSNGSHTTYVSLAADRSGNTYAVWGGLDLNIGDPSQLINNKGPDPYVPMFFAKKSASERIFGKSIESNLKNTAATKVNTLYSIQVDPQNTPYVSMMNFFFDGDALNITIDNTSINTDQIGELVLKFTPYITYKGSTNQTFTTAKKLYNNNPNLLVAVPFFKLNNTGVGVVASYTVDINQSLNDSNDDSGIIKSFVKFAIKPYDSTNFSDLYSPLRVDYFEVGPNTIAFKMETNPYNGRFFMVYNRRITGTDKVSLLYRNHSLDP